MTYHPSLHDYMENIHGKEIPLQYVTVKVRKVRVFLTVYKHAIFISKSFGSPGKVLGVFLCVKKESSSKTMNMVLFDKLKVK